MAVEISTKADFNAYMLLKNAGEIDTSSTRMEINYTDAGNMIIALAERIKAQRAVVAMQHG